MTKEIKDYSITFSDGSVKTGKTVSTYENGQEVSVEEYYGSTAEEWLNLQNYGGTRPTTLLYLKLKLESSGKQSPKLNAVQQWIDLIILGSVANPDIKSFEWQNAPYSFVETTQEVLEILSQ